MHAERDVRNDLDRVRIPGDTGMERSRNVFRRALYTLRIAAGNASIPRPPRRPADLIRQSGLADKDDRTNE